MDSDHLHTENAVSYLSLRGHYTLSSNCHGHVGSDWMELNGSEQAQSQSSL